MGRKVPMWQCIIAILAMVVFLFWNVMKDDGGEAHGGLILAACVAGIIGAINGWKWSYMEQGILAAINRSMQAILILAVVGAMIASWKAGDTEQADAGLCIPATLAAATTSILSSRP